MVQALRSNWILWVSLLFIVINGILIAQEIFWLMALPALLLVVWALFTSVDRLLLFIVMATPLSLNLEDLELGGIGFYFPTEPLMLAITLLFLVKVMLEKNVLDPRVWRHPVTIAVGISLLWTAVCIIPSTMPLVSVKFLIARMWFICAMYFVATRLFENKANIHRFFWSYTGALVIVVIYTVINHAQYAFEQDPAHWVMTPFFKDHTSYGASIAMVLPFAIGAINMPNASRTARGIAVLLFLILLVGLIFSYTRAAWVSLAGALAVFIAIRLRIRFWIIALLLLTSGGTYLAYEDQILITLERNREESSDDLGEHVRSISNISSDASNLERINRWNSAIRMFQERPIFGFGPGTYMFQYAPFQASRERTIISTNFGTQGNAHSEYLGPLSESGLIGMLAILAVIILTSITAIRTYRRIPAGRDRMLLICAFLGLMTYYMHGILNNFLDTDKASVPFWGFTAMIVVLDVKYRDTLPEPAGEDGDVVEVG